MSDAIGFCRKLWKYTFFNQELANRRKLAKALGVAPEDLLPNYSEQAALKDVPTFQIQQVGSDSKQVWLHVNQKISSEQALRVMAILNEE